MPEVNINHFPVLRKTEITIPEISVENFNSWKRIFSAPDQEAGSALTEGLLRLVAVIAIIVSLAGGIFLYYRYQQRITEDLQADRPSSEKIVALEFDLDQDGLTVIEELKAGTNSENDDTDFDTVPDGWEVAHALNPLAFDDAEEDADDDGLKNIEEFSFQTNPKNPDTDADNISDGIEVSEGFNPAGPGLITTGS